jgi:hypothetical protein
MMWVQETAAATRGVSLEMPGGNLPQNCTALVPSETMEVRHEVVLSFPSHDRHRFKASD